MVKCGNFYKADKGKHFVLTEKGKEWASYKNYEVGKPIDEDDTYGICTMIEDGALEEVVDTEWIVKPGYMVVRDYKGTQLPCGNGIVFPDKQMAERYRDNYRELYKRWNKDEIPYITDATYERKKPKENKKYEDKTVFVRHNWFCEIGIEGDLVDNDIAMDMANCVPPAYFTTGLIQCGEPSDHRVEGAVYATFVRVDDDVWEYKGDCLRGRPTEHGTLIPMV